MAAASSHVSVAAAVFKWDASHKNSNTRPQLYTFSDGGLTVTKKEQNRYIYNVEASPPQSHGVFSFCVRVEVMKGQDQFNTVGLKDSTDGHLRSKGCAIRLDNGGIYVSGSHMGGLRAVRQGDTVQVTIDMASNAVTFRINGGAAETVSWTKRKGPVRPAAAVRSIGSRFRLMDSKTGKMAVVKNSTKTVEECPICFENCDSVETLKHVTDTRGDVSSHKACAECRRGMIKANSKCPWCRDDVVWKQVFGFLDGLKGSVGKAMDPQACADLMAQWEVYELTRSNADVVEFARDMVQDVALHTHLERAIKSNRNFLRDSSGLWSRFHAMVLAGELDLEPQYAALLAEAVEAGVAHFESNGGGAPEHGGAMYAQLCVALLCARNNGMATKDLAAMTRRVGVSLVKSWAGKGGAKGKVQTHCQKLYVEAVSDLVWGGKGKDAVLHKFY